MKLFPKLVIAFSLLILFQALLTGLFVANSVRRINQDTAKLDLRSEAELINNNFYAWKRHIWKRLVSLKELEEESVAPDQLNERINSILRRSSIDAMVMLSDGVAAQILEIGESDEFRLPPESSLQSLFSHPYIRLHYYNENFYLTGVAEVSFPGRIDELHLIKQIDITFIEGIILEPKTRVVFHTADKILAGNLADTELLSSPRLNATPSAYTEIIGLPHGESSYNIASTQCGTAGSTDSPESVYLTAILSNDPYRDHILEIEHTVAFVSLITMLITVGLSLLISRSITKPVIQLADAMGTFQSGLKKIRIPQAPRDEIGILVQGFNQMATRLNQDQIEIRSSLEEITFLNRYNERVINSIRDAIAVIDDSMVIAKSNHYFKRLFPKAEHLDSLPFDEESRNNITRVVRRKQDFWTSKLRLGQNGIYEMKVYPLHRDGSNDTEHDLGVLVLEDVSEQIAYEEKIFQAEKLATISILTAGIAHEINNPLGSILTNVQNLMVEHQEDGETLQLIESEALRIARIIRELLDFTSQEQDRKESCNPRSVVEEVCHLIRHSRRSGGDKIPPIEFNDPDTPAEAAIPKGELMQIYINLLQNAIHATPDQKSIMVSFVDQPEENTILITVADQGVGIESQHLGRVFDPFFTTKSNREGTGLGLSVVYGIVQKYEGKIDIQSELGRGTKVYLTLPMVDEER